MPVDATGATTTKFGIPKYNTSGDAPSGKGLNNIMDSLDTILSNLGIAGLVANDVPVYDSVAGKWKKATGTPSSTTFLRGDGSWAQAGGETTGLFSAYRSTAQSIPTSAFTPVVFDTEEFDVSNWYDTTTGKYTPQVAGYYLLATSLWYSTVILDGNRIGVALGKNGSVFKQLSFGHQSGSDGDVNRFSGAVIVHANGTTDFFTSLAYQGNAGAANIGATAPTDTWFQGHLIARG